MLLVIADASREQGAALLDLFYPNHDNFWLGLIPGVPTMLMFLLSGWQATPLRTWYVLYFLLLLAQVVLLCWQPRLWLSDKSVGDTGLALVVADTMALIWLLTNRRLRACFNEEEEQRHFSVNLHSKQRYWVAKGSNVKSLRLMLCTVSLALTGCSTVSSVDWSAANLRDWSGSPTRTSEQGVGELAASTPLQEQAIADTLDDDYRLRSGIKTANGNVVRFLGVMEGDNMTMVINSGQDTIGHIDVLDSDIPAGADIKIGTPFSDLYNEAFGGRRRTDGDDSHAIECKAEGSQHISYQLNGEWSGPKGLTPSGDTLRNWRADKVIQRR